MRPNDRVPVIPLPYSHKELAVENELMVDFGVGKVYVQKSDGTTYDLSDTIIAEILKQNLDTGKLVVTIDDIGEINIENFLNILYAGVIATSSDPDNKVAIPEQQRFDLSSITIKNNRVMVKGFDQAQSGMLPYKNTDGVIEWRYSGTAEQELSNGAASGDVSLSTPDPINVIQLTFGVLQKTEAISGIYTVKMPEVTKSYSKFAWKVSVSTEATLNFDANIVWQYTGDELVYPNSIHVFEFETWDQGVTWLGKNTKYGSLAVNEPVTVEYLNRTVYNKDEVNDMLAWNNSKSGYENA